MHHEKFRHFFAHLMNFVWGCLASKDELENCVICIFACLLYFVVTVNPRPKVGVCCNKFALLIIESEPPGGAKYSLINIFPEIHANFKTCAPVSFFRAHECSRWIFCIPRLYYSLYELKMRFVNIFFILMLFLKTFYLCWEHYAYLKAIFLVFIFSRCLFDEIRVTKWRFQCYSSVWLCS